MRLTRTRAYFRGSVRVADYQRMYAILCKAIDDAIDPLKKIPLALPWAARLRKALLEAEDVYIDAERTDG